MTGDCHSNHCITCGDVGTPMRVRQVDSYRSLALCEADDGSTTSVEIALVEPVEEGDELLVHAGVGLVRLDRSTADCRLSIADSHAERAK